MLGVLQGQFLAARTMALLLRLSMRYELPTTCVRDENSLVAGLGDHEDGGGSRLAQNFQRVDSVFPEISMA